MSRILRRGKRKESPPNLTECISNVCIWVCWLSGYDVKIDMYIIRYVLLYSISFILIGGQSWRLNRKKDLQAWYGAEKIQRSNEENERWTFEGIYIQYIIYIHYKIRTQIVKICWYFVLLYVEHGETESPKGVKAEKNVSKYCSIYNMHCTCTCNLYF